MSAVDSLEADIINYFFRNQTVTQPTQVYMALSTTTPTDAGTNFTEPSGANGYSRQLITFGDPAGTGSTTNTNAITFGPVTNANWGTITHIGFYFVSSGGTLKVYKSTASRVLNVGQSVSWGIGDIALAVN